MEKTLIVTFDDSYDLPAVMRGIAAAIEDGFTSGYYPTWEMS